MDAPITKEQAEAIQSAQKRGIPRPSTQWVRNSGTVCLRWVTGGFQIDMDLKPDGMATTRLKIEGGNALLGNPDAARLYTQAVAFNLALQSAFGIQTSGML